MEDDSGEDGQDMRDNDKQKSAKHFNVIFSKSNEVTCFDIQKNAQDDTQGSSNRLGFSFMKRCILCDRLLEQILYVPVGRNANSFKL